MPTFGRDKAVHRDASPINAVQELLNKSHRGGGSADSALDNSSHVSMARQMRVLLLNAESDFYLHEDARELKEALQQSGVDVQAEVLAGYSHRSIMYTRDLVAAKVDRFIRAQQDAQAIEQRVPFMRVATLTSYDQLPVRSA